MAVTPLRPAVLTGCLPICRGTAGDVYVNYPQNQIPHSKPHTSYHASGQHHEKNANYKFGVRHQQKPNASFVGTENVVTFGIATGESRAINVPCDPAKFWKYSSFPRDHYGWKSTDTSAYSQPVTEAQLLVELLMWVTEQAIRNS